MALVLNMPESVERALTEAARERGVSPEVIALEALAQFATKRSAQDARSAESRLEALNNLLADLSRDNVHLKPVQEQYLTREYFYTDPE